MTDPLPEICSPAVHLSVSTHAKLKGRAFLFSSEHIPPGLQPACL